MKIQDLLNDHDLDLSVEEIKAFFLGVLSSEQPLPFSRAMSELLAEVPESVDALSPELKTIWNSLEKNTKQELGNMFQANEKIVGFLESAKDQLDFFLTGMSLSGTNADSCEDEELLEFIEVVEEMIEEMDEYVSETNPNTEKGEELKEYLFENWEEFVSSQK